VLGKARESANTLKCAANLRSVGQGIAVYIAESKGTLPASNFYKGLSWDAATGQIPTQPVDGYVHWSSFLYANKRLQGTDTPYQSLNGWDAFTCPSVNNGGLPPANTFDANHDGLPNEVPGKVDWQAPRLAYTVNEALCPRGLFQQFFSDRGNIRVYHYVKAGRVRNSAQTILATEIWSSQQAVQTASLTGGGELVSASRRPLNGFTGGMINPEQLYKLPLRSTFTQAVITDLGKDPERNPGSSPTTLLDWVGRNHGRKTTDSKGYDARKTNFLYLDGHVETKHVSETIKPFQWGDRFYTLEQN
jgi:prepilin-type processing-associated H-X9-DG protein